MNNKKFLVWGVIVLMLVVGFSYYRGQAKNIESEITEEVQEEVMEEKEMVTYMDISPMEAKKMIDESPELIVIDVSSAYKDGHLPGAINYYVGDGSLEKAIPGLDKDATYLVYCHVDSASIQGAQMLVDAGFENVYRLEGNYDAWLKAGYETEM